MNPIVFAMRHPITQVMLVVALIGAGGLALNRMRVDIFPALNEPQIYVINNFAGMDPSQIEGFMTNVYELNFQYVDGLKRIESKNVQNLALLKLVFYPGTDMASAMSQVVSLATRASGQMPPSVLPPFVMRFDAANVPIGYLVVDSKTRKLGELTDLAQTRIRPLLGERVPGTVSFSPFGSNTRAIVITVDPERLRAHNLSPQDVVMALNTGNIVSPSGNLYSQGQMPMVPTNAMLDDPHEMGLIPITPGKDVYIRDVATIQDTTDINYGLRAGQRPQVGLSARGQEGHGLDLDGRPPGERGPAVFPLGNARRRAGPLRVRRVAHGACGDQIGGHRRRDRGHAGGIDDPAFSPRRPHRDRGAAEHSLGPDGFPGRVMAHGPHAQRHVVGRVGPGHRHPRGRGRGHD